MKTFKSFKELLEESHPFKADVKSNSTGEFKVEVIADDSGKWASNGMKYATPEDAKKAALSLTGRWMLVQKWRVVDSTGNVKFEGDA